MEFIRIKQRCNTVRRKSVSCKEVRGGLGGRGPHSLLEVPESEEHLLRKARPCYPQLINVVSSHFVSN